jgi:aminomethyltransferase
MSGETIKTAFHDVQAAIGGTFVEIGGWLWCKGFGDTEVEYRAVRDDVAVWDISPLRKWDFRGPDALDAAQRVHSNDVLGLEVGQVHYGALLDEQGMMVDDGTVFKLADDRCWVMINGTAQQEYFDEATKGMNVSIEWITPQMPHLGIVGPRSREVVSKLCDGDLSGLRYYRFIPEQVKVGGVPVWLSRTGFGGEMGYELFTGPEHAEDLWKVVVDEADAPPFGVDAIEILRIEAGMIVAGFDYEPHTRSPYDFSLDRFVKLDAPGDFVGKGKLRDVAANLPNRFKTLKLDRLKADQLAEYGADVLKDREIVGTLTSPTTSPRYGKIGIASIRADLADDGTALEVAFGDGTVPAAVDVLPIYDPEKKRPRG